MTTAVRMLRPAALVAGGAFVLAALGATTGCAGTAQQRERETALKQAKSHFEIGVDHLNNGRIALALRELMAAEELAPDQARVQYALGEAYMRKGLYEPAEKHLLRTLELDPTEQDARLSLSGLYIEQERYADAVTEANLLIDDATFPGPWRALANAGWAEFKLGNAGVARRHLELALEYNPQYWRALLSLGILEAHEGHRPEAIALLQRLLDQDPPATPSAVAEANYRMAEIYVSLGKRDRAVSHLLAAVEKAPNGRWGQKSEEYLKLLR